MIGIETANLFNGEAMLGRRVVLIEGGTIADIVARPPPGLAVHRLRGEAILTPGFIDIQVNGGDGVLLNDEPTVAGMRKIAAAHGREGTTSLLPTLISGERAMLRSMIAATQAALAEGIPGVFGLHVEGPFISRARKGIHPEDAITDMTADDLALLCQPRLGTCLLTLAPEVVPLSHIAALAKAGVAVFLGHTDADCEVAQSALAAGARGFTHLFNAMSQLGSRAPGAVGAALASVTACASIIIDGYHVHAAAVQAAFRAIGTARLMLISDAMPSVGANAPDHFELAGRPINLVNGRLTDAAGTLAGAHLTMADAVRNAIKLAGCNLVDSLRMATATPADCLCLADRGRLAPGLRADLVALDANLAVSGVWQGGERVR
jgi:N-acetylglucosamine-6-phosphate deacetylase